MTTVRRSWKATVAGAGSWSGSRSGLPASAQGPPTATAASSVPASFRQTSAITEAVQHGETVEIRGLEPLG